MEIKLKFQKNLHAELLEDRTIIIKEESQDKAINSQRKLKLESNPNGKNTYQ